MQQEYQQKCCTGLFSGITDAGKLCAPKVWPLHVSILKQLNNGQITSRRAKPDIGVISDAEAEAYCITQLICNTHSTDALIFPLPLF